MQKMGSEGGRRGFSGTSMQGLRWQFPGSPPPASPMTWSGTLGSGFFVFQFWERPPWPQPSDSIKKKLKCYR